MKTPSKRERSIIMWTISWHKDAMNRLMEKKRPRLLVARRFNATLQAGWLQAGWTGRYGKPNIQLEEFIDQNLSQMASGAAHALKLELDQLCGQPSSPCPNYQNLRRLTHLLGEDSQR